MVNQSAANDDNVQQAIDAIEKLHDAPGFIVDLRQANGGSEPLAQRMAQLFCAKDTVYAKSKYRNGVGHGEFTEEFPRTLPGAKIRSLNRWCASSAPARAAAAKAS